jgi:putative FmdB family regulatory protein
MPILTFRCEQCGHRLEKVAKFIDPPPLCPECGLPTERVLGVPGKLVWNCNKPTA